MPRLALLRRTAGTAAVALAALVALTARAAHAQPVIYSTFGPGDGWSGATGVVGSLGGKVAGWFTAPAAGAVFEQVRLPLFANWLTGSPAGSAMTLTLHQGGTVLPTNGGTGFTPDGGAVLETLSVSTELPASTPWQIFTVQSTLRPTLLPGTVYWLVASAPDATSNFSWGSSSTNTQAFAYRYTNQGWYTYPTNLTRGPAFEVRGGAPTSTVPEPASLALVGMGLGAVGVVARRRAR